MVQKVFNYSRAPPRGSFRRCRAWFRSRRCWCLAAARPLSSGQLSRQRTRTMVVPMVCVTYSWNRIGLSVIFGRCDAARSIARCLLVCFRWARLEHCAYLPRCNWRGLLNGRWTDVVSLIYRNWAGRGVALHLGRWTASLAIRKVPWARRLRCLRLLL